MTINKKMLMSMVCIELLASHVAFAHSRNDETNQLKQRISKLEKSATKIKTTGGGLRISNKNSGSSFKLNGRFHLDYDNFDGAYNGMNQGKRASDLFIRRARIGISGNMNPIWSYKFTLAFGGGNRSGTNREDGRIQNAILSYNGFKKMGGPQVQVGKIKEDTTLEATTSSNYITTISRSTIVNAVSPFFNWGLRVNQNFKQYGLRYAVGMYQAADGSSNGREDANGKNLWAFTGRANFAPIATKDKVIHLGIWGSYRDNGDAKFRNRARGEIRNTNIRLLDSRMGGQDVAVKNITEGGVEFAGVYGPFSLQSEYIKRNTDTVDSADSKPNLSGYYVTGSYFITGESRYYDQAKGVFSQPKGIRHALEAYVRFSDADSKFDNAELDNEPQGTEVEVLTLGMNYYVNPQVRLMFDYLDTKVSGSSDALAALSNSQDKGKGVVARVQYLF
ncbi:porin [Parashewanella curva]|uniref:Porin n=1 Tax=Parashewanella curva TaxID=2338552 RepID=A0A3L8PW88_9GAMM|nr:porin [Parashewanella curva]RLV59616.1 porin [Parashewanella curva]